jgi:CRP-like cAMP-binding protein
VSALEQSRLLAGLGQAALDVLLSASEQRALLGGDELFDEGDEGGSLFFIETGAVEIYKAIRPGVDRVLSTVGPGSVLGELSFLDGSRRSAGARAPEPALVRELSRSAFDQGHPQLAASFFAGLSGVIAERLRLTNELYRQSVLSWMEATGADTLHLHRLAENFQLVTLHLSGGAAVSGRILEVVHQAPGWAILVKGADERVSLVPYHALVWLEVAG